MEGRARSSQALVAREEAGRQACREGLASAPECSRRGAELPAEAAVEIGQVIEAAFIRDRAQADHTNSAAFGNGATTTRANQQVFGTASNSYSMPRQTFAMRAGWGGFDDTSAVSFTAAGLVAKDLLRPGAGTLVADAGLSAIAVIAPKLIQAPSLDKEKGMLHLKGYFRAGPPRSISSCSTRR